MDSVDDGITEDGTGIGIRMVIKLDVEDGLEVTSFEGVSNRFAVRFTTEPLDRKRSKGVFIHLGYRGC